MQARGAEDSGRAPVLRHGEAWLDNVRLHYVEAGTGPLVVLLHGFPEFWYGWRHQIPALAAAGFRVVAPDLRGYNLSDKPQALGSYRIGNLVEDVRGLVLSLGAPAAHIVGHDWGGVIAFQVAMRESAVVNRLVVLNAPHPALVRRERWNLAQMARFWYAAFFQLPRLPERILRARDFAIVRRLFRENPSRRDAFTAMDIERYVEALAQPGALTGMLNYYRAMRRRSARDGRPRKRTIDAPTLVIWGDRDSVLGPWFAEGLEGYIPNVRVTHFPSASHWVQHDEPERVSAEIVEFLKG